MLPGKTFHWSGEYEINMNNRRTLLTELGVFETFTPTLPNAHMAAPFVLLANIAPSLQLHVLNQMRRPKFVAADTMDLWLNIALPDLLKLLKRLDAFVLNDTGAGDSFVGGMMGYLARARGAVEQNIRRAMIYGSVVASFCCEGFGLKRTTGISRELIEQRVRELERLTKF